MKTLLSSLFLLVGLSAFGQIDNCCINPEWKNPNGICPMIYDPVIGCDGQTYGNSCEASNEGITSWTALNTGVNEILTWDCNQIDVFCTSWSGTIITEVGFWTNPNDPCEMGECSPTGEFYGVAVDCMEEWMVPCDGEWVTQDGECCATCIETQVICTSYSGVQILEAGDWTNPNDPCESGYCDASGDYFGLIIDCMEDMGMPCDGTWILEDGACCAECVETPVSDCEKISITLTNGWNMIGFSCAENTDALTSFAPIQDKIIIAKDGVGNAYLPEWEFNGIGDLVRGYGYLIKVTEEITDYSICD